MENRAWDHVSASWTKAGGDDLTLPQDFARP